MGPRNFFCAFTKMKQGGLINHMRPHLHGKTDNLIAIVNSLIFHSYFTVGNQVFLQIIGLGMGLDPAPFMANLHLFCYEFKFLDELSKTHYSLARKLNHTKRYIDDLITLNGQSLIHDR